MSKSRFILDCHALSRWAMAGIIPALLGNPSLWRDTESVSLDDVRRVIEHTAKDVIATEIRKRIAREFPSIANAMFDIAAMGSFLADWQAPFWARVEGLAVDFTAVKQCPASRRRPELPDYPEFVRLVGACIGAAIARLPAPDVPPGFVAAYVQADARLCAHASLLEEAIASRESAIKARYRESTEETRGQKRRRVQVALDIMQNASKVGIGLTEFARLLGMDGATRPETLNALSHLLSQIEKGDVAPGRLYRIRQEVENRQRTGHKILTTLDNVMTQRVKSKAVQTEEWQ